MNSSEVYSDEFRKKQTFDMFDNDPFADRRKMVVKSDNLLDLIYLLIHRLITIFFSIACKLA